MTFTFIARACSDLPVATCCRVMKVSTSGFYAWRSQPCSASDSAAAWDVPKSTGKDWLSTADACKYLGVTARTLYRVIDSGQLPAYKFGRVIRL